MAAQIRKEQISGGIDGWIPANETWTYASADDPTYTFTVGADVTTRAFICYLFMLLLYLVKQLSFIMSVPTFNFNPLVQ